jgi:Activator of Hsp90 ATPase homolog 1-like protein
MSKLTTQETVYVTYIATTPGDAGPRSSRATSPRNISLDARWNPIGRADPSGFCDARRPRGCKGPGKLAVTWNIGWIEELKKLPEAIVTYEIEPMGEVVRLTMTESHPTPIPDHMLEGGRRGWPVILCGLKSLLETGRVPKIPTPQPPNKPDQ